MVTAIAISVANAARGNDRSPGVLPLTLPLLSHVDPLSDCSRSSNPDTVNGRINGPSRGRPSIQQFNPGLMKQQVVYVRSFLVECNLKGCFGSKSVRRERMS